MTSERAIIYLGALRNSYGMAAGINPNSQTAREMTPYIEALRMGVEALEAKKITSANRCQSRNCLTRKE